MVSAAICRAPGGAATNFSDWTAGMALAVTVGVTAAAAPTSPAPLRKLRRLALGQRCLDISSSRLRQRTIWPVLALFSSGCHSGPTRSRRLPAERGQHDALDALAYGLGKRRINWVLDADIRSFFDAISHAWLIRFIEHRIGDRRIVRLIRKWLAAGVLEEGRKIET